jgi:Rrf2 family protein
MLSKATEYAIRALVYIHIQNRKEKKPGFKEIAKEIDSPEQFTAKVLQTLTRHDIIRSAKGRGGGFFFDKDTKELKLYDVIRILEGDNFFNQCIFGFKFCDDKYPCPLHDDFMKIWKDFKELTEKQSIQSLAEKIENHEAYINKLDINN